MTPEEIKKINELFARNDKLSAEVAELKSNHATSHNDTLIAINARLDDISTSIDTLTKNCDEKSGDKK